MFALLAVVVIAAASLALYVAPLLPIGVSLVTKSNAPSWLKSGLLTLFAGVTAVVAPVIQSGSSLTLDTKFATTFLMTFVVAIASYYGLTKPLGIAGSEGVVAKATAGFGLGKSSPGQGAPTTNTELELAAAIQGVIDAAPAGESQVAETP